MYGEAGDDVLNGGAGGLDQLIGGDGIDRVSYAGSLTGVQVNLAAQSSWDGVISDFFQSIENATGSNHADVLIGSADANTLNAGGGSDTLYGGAGDDVLDGGVGNDSLFGGDGADTAVFSGIRAAYTISVSGGVTTVTGPDGTDTLQTVERLQFADMTTDLAGNPAGAPPPEPAKDEAQVLPPAPDDVAKGGGPQTLPGETAVLPTLVRDRVTGADFAPQDGDIAATLSLFGELPADDGYLFSAGTDTSSPEVLPVMHDDFVLTAKFEGPPVLTALEVDFDGVGFAKDIEFVQGLLHSPGDQNLLNPYISADGLTLFDDWPGIPSPTRHDVWG